MPPENERASTPFGAPTTSGPKPRAGYQDTVDRVMRTLLRTLLVSRLIGSRLLTLTVIGRKSGKKYVIAVAYTVYDGTLLVGTVNKKWVRNLIPGTPVELRLRGRKVLADQVVFTDQDNVLRLYDVLAGDNRANAGYSGIGFDPDGSPNRADLYQAWRNGAAVIQLTPRSG